MTIYIIVEEIEKYDNCYDHKIYSVFTNINAAIKVKEKIGIDAEIQECEISIPGTNNSLPLETRINELEQRVNELECFVDAERTSRMEHNE